MDKNCFIFLTEALDVKHGDRSFKLCNGDIVVMDNCRFHHGRNTEPQLRAMLANRNVSLVFQPPYHPQLNTCEYCFSQLKSYLKEHERYALEFTEMAICDELIVRKNYDTIFIWCLQTLWIFQIRYD